MKEPSIEAEFIDMRREVIHPYASENQLREMRRAFYGGAISTVNIIEEALTFGTAHCQQTLDRLRSQCIDFKDRVLRGDA